MNQPNVAIDTVPVIFDPTLGLEAIVAPRKFKPHFGVDALPGVLLLGGESVLEASQRALESKAGISKAKFAQTLGVYDNPGRDPRSTTLTIAQLFTVPRDEGVDPSVSSVSMLAPGNLPFDHATIISDAAPFVATLLDTNPEFVKTVLGEEFETNEMKTALTSVGVVFNPANLSRTLSSKPWLSRAGSVKSSGAGRPSTVWKVTV